MDESNRKTYFAIEKWFQLLLISFLLLQSVNISYLISTESDFVFVFISYIFYIVCLSLFISRLHMWLCSTMYCWSKNLICLILFVICLLLFLDSYVQLCSYHINLVTYIISDYYFYIRWSDISSLFRFLPKSWFSQECDIFEK